MSEGSSAGYYPSLKKEDNAVALGTVSSSIRENQVLISDYFSSCSHWWRGVDSWS